MSNANGFVKMDFHVHTPLSICYDPDFGNATPQEIVDAAIAAGLRAFAVTDHNTAQSVDPIREVGRAKGVTVFPGCELTTPGGHVLAFFDPATPTSLVEELLRRVGIPQRKGGDPWAMTAAGILDVFAEIVAAGGIAVAAHIERSPRGFLEWVRDNYVRKKIHASDHLSALEITVPTWKNRWNEGLVEGFPKKYAVVQGSDAHAPNEMGRRPVYVRLPSPTLPALQAALADHYSNLFFPGEFPGAKEQGTGNEEQAAEEQGRGNTE